MKRSCFSLIYTMLLGFVFLKTYSQGTNIDSCINVLKISKEDTNKVILLNRIAWDISYSNLQKGISYGNQAFDLAKN